MLLGSFAWCKECGSNQQHPRSPRGKCTNAQ